MTSRDEHIKRIVEAAQNDKKTANPASVRIRRPAASAPAQSPSNTAKKTKHSTTITKKANSPYPQRTAATTAPRRKINGATSAKSTADNATQTETIQQKLSKNAPQEKGESKDRKHFVWAGMAFLFITGFLLFSTISYFKYWKVDQNIALWSELFSGSAQNAMNWCGRLGAIVAQDIVGRWFGIFGVLTAPLAAIIALKLFRIEGLRLHKWLRSTLLVMFTGSVVCGHFFGVDVEAFGSGWGGEMGIYAAQWLQAIIGNEGTALLLTLTALAILYYVNAKFVRDVYSKVRRFMEETARKRRLVRAAAELREIEMAQRLAQQKAELRKQQALQQAQQQEYRQTQQAQQPINRPTPLKSEPINPATINPSVAVQAQPLETVPVINSEDIITTTATEDIPEQPTQVSSENISDEQASESVSEANNSSIIDKQPTEQQQFTLIELEGNQVGVVTGYDPETEQQSYLYMDKAALSLLAQPSKAANLLTSNIIDNNKTEDYDDSEDEIFTLSETPQPEPTPQAVTQSPIYQSVTSEHITPSAQPAPPTPVAKELANTSTQLAPDFVAHRPIEEPQVIIEEIEKEDEVDDIHINEMELYDPTLELRNYKKPPIELLRDHSRNVVVSDEELMDNKNRIVHTLETFGIRIDSIEVVVGPTITLYEIVPAPGIRISKIKNLEDDIAMALSALGIRIIAPIPGKGTIGIEVPNKDKNIVSMYSVIKSARFQESKADLPIALGKTIQNETFVLDLAKMPHLLVAGATGQGKSVGLNAIITSLIYKKHPSELKFVLVDPKKVELTLYAKLENHFLAKIPDADEAIITDNQKVIFTLNSICIEMEARYTLLKEARVRGIKEYNDKFTHRRLNPEKGHRYLPYFVVIIDEFADLIMTSGREIETPIARIAQLARAVGIHLIIATQRPTTNIITGVIKANFPARVAFRVTSQIDSRTILDQSGANQLVGQGDMLVSTGNDVTRVQCAFVDTPEVELIVDHIAAQKGYEGPYELPDYQPETDSSSGSSREEGGKRDPLFEDVAHYVVANQVGSASTIQRKFSIGFNRAGRIVDQLEAAGVIGPTQGGSKPRQVLISDPMTLENIFY